MTPEPDGPLAGWPLSRPPEPGSASNPGGLGEDADDGGDRLSRIGAAGAHGDLLATGRAEPHDAEHALGVGPARSRGQLDGGFELRRRDGQRAGRAGMQGTSPRDRFLTAFWHDVPPRLRPAPL